MYGSMDTCWTSHLPKALVRRIIRDLANAQLYACLLAHVRLFRSDVRDVEFTFSLRRRGKVQGRFR